jgi:hypothetical protein
MVTRTLLNVTFIPTLFVLFGIPVKLEFPSSISVSGRFGKTVGNSDNVLGETGFSWLHG